LPPDLPKPWKSHWMNWQPESHELNRVHVARLSFCLCIDGGLSTCQNRFSPPYPVVAIADGLVGLIANIDALQLPGLYGQFGPLHSKFTNQHSLFFNQFV